MFLVNILFIDNIYKYTHDNILYDIMTVLYSTDAELLQFVNFFLLASLFFNCPISWSSFSLAVQDERGPRKSKLPKITEINTVEPKNWKTRSKMYKLMIPFVTPTP